MSDHPRYILVIEAPHQSDDAEGVRRLRLALKAMLRGYRLKCVEVRRVDALEAKPERQEGKP